MNPNLKTVNSSLSDDQVELNCSASFLDYDMKRLKMITRQKQWLCFLPAKGFPSVVSNLIKPRIPFAWFSNYRYRNACPSYFYDFQYFREVGIQSTGSKPPVSRRHSTAARMNSMISSAAS